MWPRKDHAPWFVTFSIRAPTFIKYKPTVRTYVKAISNCPKIYMEHPTVLRSGSRNPYSNQECINNLEIEFLLQK